ncbi:hypothetical protein HYALB_00009320 [Hymenoscyphus albidus]|uniref:Uncharacterized protein n=1 Tax=Hymenoscyphus albidus TaxID=595503 RepID=A0A9N9PWH7_9HELO|nr:hypothetical protein HYALB_00009320 [Hymenoscyphus albidus]
MSTSHGRLCRTCRNLNLRIDSFIQTGWRYQTSPEYELNHLGLPTSYAPDERLEDDRDYTDENLANLARN